MKHEIDNCFIRLIPETTTEEIVLWEIMDIFKENRLVHGAFIKGKQIKQLSLVAITGEDVRKSLTK